jgi:uncharacterized protein (TIGR03546 family)
MGEFLSSIFGMVRGGIHPREVGLAVLLGVLAGFVAGWNLTLVALLLLVLVLRVPLRVFLQAWGLSLLLAWAMTAASFHLGRFVLEQSPLGRWLAPQADRLWVVLFDWDRYTLIGGLVWGLVLGAPAAWLMAHLTSRLQHWHRALAASVSTSSPTLRPALRLAYWAIFGGLPQAAAPAQPARLLRPGGIAVAVLLLLPCGLWCYACGSAWTAQRFLDLLSLANQAEVTADHVELSFSDGLLSLHNLQVPDAACLDRDRFRIGTLTAQLKPSRLLRGELHIERLLVEDVRCDVPRDRPARPVQLHLPRLDLDDALAAADEAARQQRRPIEDISLDEWFAHWDTYRQHLEHVRYVLQRLDEWCGRPVAEGTSAPQAGSSPVLAEELALRTARCDFGRRRLPVVVDTVRVRRFDPAWGLGAEATLELTNLTSHPRRLGQPTQVRFAAPQHHLRVEVQLNYHEPQQPHRVAFDAQHIPLAALLAGASDSLRRRQVPAFSVGSGEVRLQGQGHLDSRHVDVAFRLQLRDVQLRIPGTDELAGISPQLWNNVLSQLDACELPARLHGPWSAPKLQLETQQVVAALRDQLWRSGYHELAMQLEQQFAAAKLRARRLAEEHIAAAGELIDQGQAHLDAARQRVDQWADAAPQAAQSLAASAREKAHQAQQAAEEHLTAAAQQAHRSWQHGASIAQQWLQSESARLAESPAAPAEGGSPALGHIAALPQAAEAAAWAGRVASPGTSPANIAAALTSSGPAQGQRVLDSRHASAHDAASTSNRGQSLGLSASDAIRHYVHDRLGRANTAAILPQAERAAPQSQAAAALPPPPSDHSTAALQQQVQNADPFPHATAATGSNDALQYPPIEPIYLPESNAAPGTLSARPAMRNGPDSAPPGAGTLPGDRRGHVETVASAPASDVPPRWPTAPRSDGVDDPCDLLGPRYGSSQHAADSPRHVAASHPPAAERAPLDPRDEYAVPDDEQWPHATAVVTDVWPPETVGLAHRAAVGGPSQADLAPHRSLPPAAASAATGAVRPAHAHAGADDPIGHVPQYAHGTQAAGAMHPWEFDAAAPGSTPSHTHTAAPHEGLHHDAATAQAATPDAARGTSLHGGGWSPGQHAALGTAAADASEAPAVQPPLWKRAATSVSSGVKRLWPFGKRTTADEPHDAPLVAADSDAAAAQPRVAHKSTPRPTSGYDTPPPGASSSPSTMPSWLPKLW